MTSWAVAAHQSVVSYEGQHADRVVPQSTIHHGCQLHSRALACNSPDPHVPALVYKNHLHHSRIASQLAHHITAKSDSVNSCSLSLGSSTCQHTHAAWLPGILSKHTKKGSSLLLAKHSCNWGQHRVGDDDIILPLHINFTASTVVLSNCMHEELGLIRMGCVYLSVRSNALLIDGHRDYDAGVGYSLTQGFCLGLCQRSRSLHLRVHTAAVRSSLLPLMQCTNIMHQCLIAYMWKKMNRHRNRQVMI